MVKKEKSATKKVGGAGVVLIPPEGEALKYAVRLQFTTQIRMQSIKHC